MNWVKVLAFFISKKKGNSEWVNVFYVCGKFLAVDFSLVVEEIVN